MLEKLFRLRQNHTNVKTELLAGLTTFLTMAYVIVVNPVILSDAGVPFEHVFMATIIATVIGTLWMALFANYPIAIAPGMGLNAYFAYSVVGANDQISYEIAFGAVFVSGILFILLSLTPFREKLIEAIPDNLKYGITAGIGLFIAFIGLRMSGLIVGDPENLVGLGNLQSPQVILTLIGLGITIALMAMNINSALFLGMLITGILAFFTGHLSFEEGFASPPPNPEWFIFGSPIQAFIDVFQYGLYAVVFSFLLVTIFDTTGTMIGVAEQAGLMKGNKMPRVRQALLADSVAKTAGSIFGTSPTSAYVESSSGVAVGGRTGLTTATVALLFVLSVFFSPAISAVSGLPAITSPVLIIVGSLMLGAVSNIKWDSFDEAFPAFLVIITMPLTSSIATGIAFGFISHPLVKLAQGKGKTVHPLIYVFAVLFLLQLIYFPH
ncbi:putative MFS transporter, AGZA family, xanthine/uracil permease [Alteribacillus persepolensis]|uniref:Putative MFS transporter, AGZA family, xanthine/uracil permease n=1 Tax=Alteribacillus persepolensis TaxID=568899 RepID=A0A1G8FM18_9BACI|nr:NCS2 family permease [Alteribacillus persepolensis]SDH83190.1 putative MFS transporter, AGZA family, xanthine/uracil permease [Alteribacillus persepolensis]